MTGPILAALLQELQDDPDAVRLLRTLVQPEPPKQPDQGAFTVRTLHTHTGYGEKAIRGAISRGELPARKKGGRWVMTAEDVETWLGPPDAPPPGPRRPAARRRPLRSTFDGLGGWT